MSNQSNQLKNSLVAWIIIMVIGIIMFLIPVSFDVESSETSIVLFVMGILLAGLAMGMTINFSVKLIKQNFNKPKDLPIVEWFFTQEEWNQYCIQNLKFRIKQYLKLFYIFFIFIIAINILLFFTISDSENIKYLALSDSIPVLFILLIIPSLEYLTFKYSKPEVKIFNASVIVGGTHYNWNVPKGKLIDVKLLNENNPVILINYSTPYRRTDPIFGKMKGFYALIPVPKYEIIKGQEIVEMFQNRINV